MVRQVWVGCDFFQGLWAVQGYGRPSPYAVSLRGDGSGGVPAQPRFPFIKGQSSADIETAKQLPKHTTSRLRAVQVQVIVGDDEPAQILGFVQLPDLIFQLENLFLTGRLKRVALRRHF